jgi:hypothetical protein
MACVNTGSTKPTKPTPTPLEDLQRAAIEQAQLEKLCRMSEMLDSIETYTVGEQTLSSMDIILGQPLDVDGSGEWDYATSFFLPWVDEDLIREVDEYHDCRDDWMDKYVSDLKPAEWQIPEEKAQWFISCVDCLCELDPGIWDPWE